jgi:acetolactate synthase-1/2/3 large subunit
MSKSGAKVVVAALEAEGVRFVFGIPGTHNIELYDALADSARITTVLVTDEQAASFMADGLARSTGEVGVLNLVPGAGLTHALSGIAEAFMDNVPLVVLGCGIRRDTGRAYQLHAIDQLGVARPVTKAALRVERPEEMSVAIHRAFARARAGTPGPVVVEVPAELYLLRHEFGDAPVPAVQAPSPAAPAPALLGEAAEILAAARRPLVYAGFGARDATAPLRELAERLGAPVATTISGKGVFPESHPLFLWNGLGRSAPPFVREIGARADAMLALGCRFSEVGTASWGFTPPSKLIHVDVNAEVFGRNVPVAVAIEADAGAALEALLVALPARPRDAALEAAIARGHAEVREEWRRHPSAERVTPNALFEALQGQCGADAIFVADSGNGTFLAMEHLRLEAPGRFLAPVDYSCMGYAAPAAIGAKLASPERDVVALAGDGALLMTGLELATAAAYRAAVVVLVLRDGELAQIAQFQRTTMNRAAASALHPYHVEALAAAVNCAYLRLERDAEIGCSLEQALAMARSGQPVVVEVAIDYSRKTYFTRGVVATTFARLPWVDRVRLLGRAVARRVIKP